VSTVARCGLVMLLVAAVAAAGCDRTESSNANVTSTSPAGSSTAPSPAAAKHRDEALVRIVHAASSGAQLDLFAGDLALFDGLGFKSVTPYRAIDGQRYAFALRPAGMTQGKALSSNTEALHDGNFYTAVAMPGDGRTAELRIVHDRLDAPPAGKAQLRVIHAGIDAGEVDVRDGAANQMLFDGVDFQSVTEYRDVTPVNGAIQVVGNGAGAPVLASFNAHLEAGRFYTIVIVGSASATPKLEAFLIEDALSP
jgi:hypothetical protein